MPNPLQAAETKATTLDELLSLHDQQFVSSAYNLLLGREPDPEGLRYYLSRIRSGFAKIQILAQLCLGKEAKAYAKANKKAGLASLPGLRKAIKNYRRGQYFLIGGLFRWINEAESNHPSDRKLRAIENQILLHSIESHQRFNQLEATLSGLENLVVQQNKSINAALVDKCVVTTASHLTSQTFDPEEFKQFSPRTRDIYYQLKSAAAAFNALRSE